MNGKHIELTDQKGDSSMVSIANVYQSNGVIHVVDTRYCCLNFPVR